MYSTKHSILSSKKKHKQSCLLKHGHPLKGRTLGWVNLKCLRKHPSCHRSVTGTDDGGPVSLVTVGDQQQPISSHLVPFPASRKQASSTRMDVSRADSRKTVGCVFHSQKKTEIKQNPDSIKEVIMVRTAGRKDSLGKHTCVYLTAFCLDE